MNDEIEIERKEQDVSPSEENPKNYYTEKRNLILIGAGVLVVVLIFFFFMFSGKDKSTETLVQLEQRLAAIEQKIAILEKQQEELTGPVKRLTEKVQMLEKPPVQKFSPPVSPKAQAAPQAKRYHTIKKGETMAGIAKKYGLSVEDLRRMNNLSPKSTLTAGQKLIVSRGEKK